MTVLGRTLEFVHLDCGDFVLCVGDGGDLVLLDQRSFDHCLIVLSLPFLETCSRFRDFDEQHPDHPRESPAALARLGCQHGENVVRRPDLYFMHTFRRAVLHRLIMPRRRGESLRAALPCCAALGAAASAGSGWRRFVTPSVSEVMGIVQFRS
jgi:hypothetical protein